MYFYSFSCLYSFIVVPSLLSVLLKFIFISLSLKCYLFLAVLSKECRKPWLSFLFPNLLPISVTKLGYYNHEFLAGMFSNFCFRAVEVFAVPFVPHITHMLFFWAKAQRGRCLLESKFKAQISKHAFVLLAFFFLLCPSLSRKSYLFCLPGSVMLFDFVFEGEKCYKARITHVDANEVRS